MAAEDERLYSLSAKKVDGRTTNDGYTGLSCLGGVWRFRS